jgi:hypothetical protein
MVCDLFRDREMGRYWPNGYEAFVTILFSEVFFSRFAVRAGWDSGVTFDSIVAVGGVLWTATWSII